MKQINIRDLKKVKNFYDDVIMKQIILPLEINEILHLVNPDETTMQTYAKKMGIISRFIQKYEGNLEASIESYREPVLPFNDPRDKEYKTPSKSEDMKPDWQSHQEGDILKIQPLEEATPIHIKVEDGEASLDEEKTDMKAVDLELLKAELENETEKKKRTVLKSKITRLKNKL